MKEYLILLSGMNKENELEEFLNVIVLAENSSEAIGKADNYMQNFDDDLCWDIQYTIELTDVPRI